MSELPLGGVAGAPVLDEAGVETGVVSGLQDVDDLMTTRARLRTTLDTKFDRHVVFRCGSPAARPDVGPARVVVPAEVHL